MIKMPLITSPRATDTTKAALCLFYAFFNLRKLLYIIVFEIKRPDSAIQKIHFDIPPLHKKPDKEQTFQSAPYPAVVSLEQRALRANRKLYSIVTSASQ